MCGCRGQRATFRSSFPSSTMWSPMDWTQVIRFGSKCLYSESSGQPLCQFWQNFVCVLSVSRGQRSALGFFLSHFSTFVVSTYLFVQMSNNLFTSKQTPVILTKSAKSINSWKSKLKKKKLRHFDLWVENKGSGVITGSFPPLSPKHTSSEVIQEHLL